MDKDSIFDNIMELLQYIEKLMYVDNRKWLPLFYGNRLGFLPYTTEQEKEKILKDPLFFGYFEKDGKMVPFSDSRYNSLRLKPEKITKNKFKLEL